ncbi:MAG: hypothetical protein Q6370_012130 [Candidatus Sigynarchaeota archaeon]
MKGEAMPVPMGRVQAIRAMTPGILAYALERVICKKCPRYACKKSSQMFS